MGLKVHEPIIIQDLIVPCKVKLMVDSEILIVRTEVLSKLKTILHSLEEGKKQFAMLKSQADDAARRKKASLNIRDTFKLS